MNMNGLSCEESAIIDAYVYRKKKAAERAALDFKLKALKVAAQFEGWSQSHDEGLTFSTFVDSFGYQDPDAEKMYAAVERILKAVSVYSEAD